MNSKKNLVLLVLLILIGVAVAALILNLNSPTGYSIFDMFKGKNTDTGVGGKPDAVVTWSNGFPSGEHYNLNIHGKRSDYVCSQISGGGSIFVPEYGQSDIQLIQNRKSSVSELFVIDPCSFSSNDPAKIQLPSGEYQVYARILAKPSNKKTGEQRMVVFYPKLIDACNDNATSPIEGFGDYIDCSNESLIGLGVISADGVFDRDSTTLVRISPVRGKNQAQPITDMFTWSGYACSEEYDTNFNGEMDIGDVSSDLDGDGDIDADDLTLYLELHCSYYSHEWIFNIADLVVYGWDYYNSGSKLVQIRFYPKKTTSFA